MAIITVYLVTDLQARVNIPAPPVRTIQRKIAACKFDANASIQVCISVILFVLYLISMIH